VLHEELKMKIEAFKELPHAEGEVKLISISYVSDFLDNNEEICNEDDQVKSSGSVIEVNELDSDKP